MKNKFEEEKRTIEEGYTKSFLNSFKEKKWSKYEESGTQYMHHPTIKSKMNLYDVNNIIIPFVYDGSNTEYNEFSKNRGVWVERRNKLYQDCLQDENSKWNFHSIIIYSSGDYESIFTWDNNAYLEELATNVWQGLSYWGNDFLKPYVFNHYQSNWESAVIKTIVKDNNLHAYLIQIDDNPLFVEVEVPEEFSSKYLLMYDYCSSGELKGFFKPLNTVIFHLNCKDWFQERENTQFILE